MASLTGTNADIMIASGGVALDPCVRQRNGFHNLMKITR